jgi:hypothetical protein
VRLALLTHNQSVTRLLCGVSCVVCRVSCVVCRV